MRNLVVSGYYGSKNAGDEAMLAAMLEVLSDLDPKLHITVISADPQDTKERHGVDAVGWLDISAILQLLGHADLLISGGGSLLQNVTSRRSLYYYLGIIFLALAVHTPVMLYAQGIGPIEGSLARWLMKKIVNRTKLITVRDHGSLEELARLGIRKPRIEATADAVLAIHPVDKEAGRHILTEAGAEGTKPVIRHGEVTRLDHVPPPPFPRGVSARSTSRSSPTLSRMTASVHAKRSVVCRYSFDS